MQVLTVQIKYCLRLIRVYLVLISRFKKIRRSLSVKNTWASPHSTSTNGHYNLLTLNIYEF